MAVYQVRAVMLTRYAEVAGAVGLDGPRMLREAGLAPESLADPENRIPAEPAIRLLERSAELSGCDSFGLLMAEQRSFASVGPVSLLLERLPNMRDVARSCIVYRDHFNDVTALSLDEADGVGLIRINLMPGFWSRQAIDLFTGLIYRAFRGASHGRWLPSAVHVMRKAPRDLSVWRRMFPVRMEFESDFNGLSCSTASLLEPNPLADEAMAGNARRLLGLISFASGPRPVSERVLRSLGTLLPGGRITLNQMAAHLGMSTRSLQRRLEEEGSTFGELLDQVRRELAAGYLDSSDHPVTTVAALLGYGSPSSFTRWFATTFGTTPQAWRAQRGSGRPNALAV
jgi:AraC-like DNA-binding protein